MERKKGLERRTGLSRGEKGLSRGKGLARGTKRLKQTRKPPPSKDEQALAAAFHAHTRANATPRFGSPPLCACCGRAAPLNVPRNHPRRGHAHHVISQQKLEDVARERGIDPAVLKWDDRNGLWLCAQCHMNHEAGTKRIPFRVLTMVNLTFASDMGLDWYVLDHRRYPRAA